MPQKGDINPATGKAYAVNPATGNWDDNFWANVVEPQLKNIYGQQTSENQAQDLINTSIEAYNKQFNEYNKRYKEFDEKNPFVFDTILAEESTKVAQRLDPYYSQTLGDYLQGIERKRTRSLEDERTILSEIQADTNFYTGEAKVKLDSALERARSGAADAGLFSSGARYRAEGDIQRQSQTDLSSYLQTQGRRTSALSLEGKRLREEDLPLEERLQRRNLERERQYQVQSQAIPEVQRRGQQREFERRQFTGAPPGVNPLDFQNQSFGLFQ